MATGIIPRPGETEQPPPPTEAPPTEAPAEDPMAGGTPGPEFRQPGQMPGNETTAEIKKQILTTAPGHMKADIQRIVGVGRRIMFDPENNKAFVRQLGTLKGNVAQKLATGTAALISLVKGASKGPFPIPAMVPAATILLMEVIEFFEESKKLEVTPDLCAEATEQLTGILMNKSRIGKEDIEAARQYKGLPAQPVQPGQPPQGPPQGPPQQPPPQQPPGIIGAR